MSKLSYCKFPLSINQLNIASAYELQILVLSATLPEGLKQSNNQLAELFCTTRRTVIRAINKLKQNGHIRNIGTTQGRILSASDKVKELLNAPELVTTLSLPNTPQLVTNSVQVVTDVVSTSVKPVTHNISNTSNVNNTTVSSFSFVLKTGETWYLPQAKYDEYRQTYPDIDLDRELRKAAQWLRDNTGKAKTTAGMPRYLSSWLNRVKPGVIQTSPQAEEIQPEATEEELRAILYGGASND